MDNLMGCRVTGRVVLHDFPFPVTLLSEDGNDAASRSAWRMGFEKWRAPVGAGRRRWHRRLFR